MKTKLIPILVLLLSVTIVTMLVIPNFLRARKRSRATRVLEDLRMIDARHDQYAIEFNKKAAEDEKWAEVKRHLKPGTTLRCGGSASSISLSISLETPIRLTLGNPEPSTTTSELDHEALNRLLEISPVSFWGEYTGNLD